MAAPNMKQVGGNHYQKEEFVCDCGKRFQHWDIAWRLGWDSFMYPITKYLWRWKRKGGIEDLSKAQHYLEKYIEAVRAKQEKQGDPLDGHPTSAYTNQNRGD